ncbi:MAG: helix-turn-helix domain-containing protein [Lentisphaeria bacterium]|nr:MAG: helix-turn-helix domain-containing protein [Lentisphaeria bacterium]UKI31559.1 MAG: helix-turn-helix domain-containing protein [Lentisphaeria bacterium]UKI33457.1 MAG: helix-turn-helix domain-containing protein [Lentisphaeria bacterium]
MELRDARKINSKELYDRRKQAVLLFEKGLKRYEIAPLVGVSAYTVGQWIKAWKKGGQAALKVGNKGRPRGFTENCFRMKNGKFVVQSRIVVQIS